MTDNEPYANKRANRVTNRSHPSCDRILSALGMKLIVAIAGESRSIRYGFVDHHPCDRFAIFFLFGCVHTMRFEVDGQAVHGVLHAEISELAIVVRIVLMENGNGPAVTGHVDAAQTWIKLDHVGTTRHLEKGDRRVLV